MTTATVIAYGASIAVGLGLGLLLLVVVWPRRARSADGAPGTDSSAARPGDPAAGVQRTSLSGSFLEAAPKGYVAWLDRQLVYAGRPAGWSIPGIALAKVFGGLTALALGALFVVAQPEPLRFLLAGFVVLLVFFLPDVMINSRAHDRQEKIELALPDTLDQMTVAVEAGLGFDSAMSKAARGGKGPLAEEMVRTLQDMSMGRSRRDAYLEMAKRTSSESLRRFIRAVVQAEAYGISIADVLRVQASEMRLKRRQRAEEQALKVTVNILFPLVFCLLPVLFIVLMTPAAIGIFKAFTGTAG